MCIVQNHRILLYKYGAIEMNKHLHAQLMADLTSSATQNSDPSKSVLFELPSSVIIKTPLLRST